MAMRFTCGIAWAATLHGGEQRVRVVTAEVMRELDRRAVQEAFIPGVILMENAGRAVVDVIGRDEGSLVGKCVAIFCGAGNNGITYAIAAARAFRKSASVAPAKFRDSFSNAASSLRTLFTGSLGSFGSPNTPTLGIKT